MKKILILLMALSLAGFLACGNDESDGQVSMTLSTEDGIESMGNIVPTDPSYATYETDIAPWLKYIQVQVFANGRVIPRNLIMSKVVGKAALLRGEYLIMDIPAGRDLIFVVNAADSSQVIQYSGMVGPINVRPKTIVPINVILRKMIADPNQALDVDLSLFRADGVLPIEDELVRFGINTTNRVFVNIYTQARKVGDQWVPTNPDYPDTVSFDPQIDGTYSFTGSASLWQTVDNLLDNMLMFITVRVEDNLGGLVFYGIRAYDYRWGSESPLKVYLQHPTRLIVRFNNLATTYTNVTATMFVNGQNRNLYKAGSFTTISSVNPTSPIAVFDSPSGEEWFTGNPVQNRLVVIRKDGQVAFSNTIPVDWGTYTIDIQE